MVSNNSKTKTLFTLLLLSGSAISVPTQPNESTSSPATVTLEEKTTANLTAREEEKTKHGYIRVVLRPWTTLGSESLGDKLIYCDDSLPWNTHDFVNYSPTDTYKDTLYLHSYEEPDDKGSKWWMEKAKRREKWTVEMPPLDPNENPLRITVNSPDVPNDVRVFGSKKDQIKIEGVTL